ncbi:MAG: nucleoside transporter C-terminal domain-containing protein, partial [Bacteroidota bacterium]
FAWLLGVPTEDITSVGQLLGIKTVMNEFMAYSELFQMQQAEHISLQPKSLIIATYALCGFANLASIGIQIGGIGAIAPGQRKTLTELGLLALLGGTIASFLTAAIAGVLVDESFLS